MSHHSTSPNSAESTGARIAGIGFSAFGIVVAGFAAFWGVAFLIGGFKAARPQPEPADKASSTSPAATATAAAAAQAAAASPVPAGSTPPPSAPAPAVADSASLPGYEEGKTLFTTICAVCHQPTGLGLPNMFPPLAGSDWVTAPGPERLIRIVLHGFQGPIKVNGTPFTTPAPMMPPQGALPDHQIAAVLTYARNAFGNKAGAVTVEQVKAVRAAEKERAAMWDEPSLLQVPLSGPKS
jgi:mono/diheme cytochrome c family protein